MSFLSTCITLLAFIFCDLFLTSIRPTWTDGGDIAHYVMVGVHVLCVIISGIVVFVSFSSTIWFAAGLLGQLFYTIAPTFPLWLVRLVTCWLPWVYKRFIVEDDEVTPWSHGVYVLLTIVDIISCVCLSVSLFYTMCCMTDKHMYVPYHTVVGQQERDNALAINANGVVGDKHGGAQNNTNNRGGAYFKSSRGGGGGDVEMNVVRGVHFNEGNNNYYSPVTDALGATFNGGQSFGLSVNPMSGGGGGGVDNFSMAGHYRNSGAQHTNGVTNDSFALGAGGGGSGAFALGLPPLSGGRRGPPSNAAESAPPSYLNTPRVSSTAHH